MPNYPFLQPAFLSALEQSDSVSSRTGWNPQHLEFTGTDGHPVLLPLYLKDHSWGEYVFDFAWAEAYQRNGLNYYPKLLTAAPFTPATGPRLHSKGTITDEDYIHAAQLAIARCEENNVSSWHLLFPEFQQSLLDETPGLLHRTGLQYHWHNHDYADFEAFLATLKSRKRKMIRRERSSCQSQNLQIAMLSGDDISDALWSQFYWLYVDTYIKRSGNRGYLTEAFFQQLGQVMSDQVCMATARKDGELVAAALYLFDEQTLYGRYWGCSMDFEHLHFELCYYQGIEFAINRKLTKFDAGAQGEHKLTRGFEPVLTHSFHWIQQPDFRTAIGKFLTDERSHIEQWQQQSRAELPYK